MEKVKKGEKMIKKNNLKILIIFLISILLIILTSCKESNKTTKKEEDVKKETKVEKKVEENNNEEVKKVEEKKEVEKRPEGAYLWEEVPEIREDFAQKIEIKYAIVYVDGIAKYFDPYNIYYEPPHWSQITDSQMWLNIEYRKKFKSPIKNFKIDWDVWGFGGKIEKGKRDILRVYDQKGNSPVEEDSSSERIYYWRMKGYGLYISKDKKWWYPVEFKLISNKKKLYPYFNSLYAIEEEHTGPIFILSTIYLKCPFFEGVYDIISFIGT